MGSIESEDCNLPSCVAPGECEYVAVRPSECPSRSGNLPDCRSDIDDGDLCEADYPLNGVPNHNVNNCPGGYDVFRYVYVGKEKNATGFLCLHRNAQQTLEVSQ